jgi:hypothetical protein
LCDKVICGVDEIFLVCDIGYDKKEQSNSSGKKKLAVAQGSFSAWYI